MSTKALTDWFDEGTTPVHVGVYEIDWNVGRGRAFSHWGGSRWGFASWEDFSGGIKEAIEDALCPSSRFSKVEKFRWRGLAYEVKA